MTTNKKAAPGANWAALSTASSGRNSTPTDPLKGWFLSISTTASCVVSLSAPMAAALLALIQGGRQ